MADDLGHYLSTRHTPEDINAKHHSHLKAQDKMAALITSAIGSMYAVYFFVIATLGWMVWQTISSRPFDPYPYVFMIFMSNIAQLILLPLIMVGQNVQSRHAQLRAEEEYKTTKTIHQDIEKILIDLTEIKKRL